MAEWNKEKVNPSDLNNGNEYDKNSQVALQEINGMVNAGLYAQDFAEHLADTPDISEINGTGTASVSFVDNPSATTNKPYKRFKFSNLKGSKGDKGDKGDTGAGSNPNLLINGDFSINQRGETRYSTNNKYTVDRWNLLYGSLIVNNDGSVTHTSKNTWQGIRQYIEYPSRLAGKTVTLSCKCSSTGPKTIQLNRNSTNLGNISVPTSEDSVLSFSTTIPSDISDDDKLIVILYTPAAGQSITYYWVKLEIGSVATEFSPRPYTEELALCQRYYQIRSNSYTIQPNAIDRPIPMRVDGTIGTITINETTYNYVDAEIY